MSIYDFYTVEQLRALLKFYFQTNKRPTQAQFYDLIDAIFDKNAFNGNIDLNCFNVLNVSSLNSTCNTAIYINPSVVTDFLIANNSIYSPSISADFIKVNKIDIKDMEIDGYTVSGSLVVTDSISAGCGNSEEWCSTYTTVLNNSSFWNADFCDELVYLHQVTGCDGFLGVSSSVVDFYTDRFIAGQGAPIDLYVTNGRVGVNTINPNVALTINGDVSSNSIIYTPCGNSQQWCSAYTVTLNNSAIWDDNYTTVLNNSSIWDDTHMSVLNNSAIWDDNYTTVLNNSSIWDDTHMSVLNNSAIWDDAHTTVMGNSSEWGGFKFSTTNSIGISTVNTTLSSHGDAVFYNILVANGPNKRASQMMIVCDGPQVVFTDTQTTDLGVTSAISLSAGFQNGEIILQSHIQNGTWHIKGNKSVV